MDIHCLDRAVERYYTAALTDSTHKTYRAAKRRYIKFCSDFALSPFPATESTLCYYVACLGQQGLAHSSIKTYLSGVRQVQISLGLPEPAFSNMPRLRQVLRGVQRVRGREPRPRLPITPNILRKIRKIWLGEKETYDNLMLWAVSATTFFSFCRAGEMVVERESAYDPDCHLSYRDLAVDNPIAPTIISLLLRRSKTDQVQKGVRVVIGRTGDEICPVTALLRYLAVRGDGPGPLFIQANGKPLTKARFVTEVRAALTKAKFPAQSYAGHSFRIGAATTAAAAGLEDSLIQTLGRWKSAAYLLYVRIDPHRLAAVSPSLANSHI